MYGLSTANSHRSFGGALSSYRTTTRRCSVWEVGSHCARRPWRLKSRRLVLRWPTRASMNGSRFPCGISEAGHARHSLARREAAGRRCDAWLDQRRSAPQRRVGAGGTASTPDATSVAADVSLELARHLGRAPGADRADTAFSEAPWSRQRGSSPAALPPCSLSVLQAALQPAKPLSDRTRCVGPATCFVLTPRSNDPGRPGRPVA